MNWDYTLTQLSCISRPSSQLEWPICLRAVKTHSRDICFDPVNVRRVQNGPLLPVWRLPPVGMAENYLVQIGISGGSFSSNLIHGFYIGIQPNQALPHAVTFLSYSIVPLVAFVMVLTNEWHALIWNSFTPGPSGTNTFIYGHGAGYYILFSL